MRKERQNKKNKNKRKVCIVCGSALLGDLVDIGEQFPSAIYPQAGADYRMMIQISSLNLTKCSNTDCGLVHLSNKYDLDTVFKYYPFLSGETATMNQILADIVKEVENLVSLSREDVVLDIGGNDGTLLSLLSKPVNHRINIDAAHGITSVLDDPDYIQIQGKFSSETYLGLNVPMPKVIFSIAMFYHLDDPVSFCKQVKDIMSDDTIWCLQLTYLGAMLKYNIYDNIVHEHVAYYSLKSLEYLMKDVGLHICDAKIVDSYGGSLRLYLMKDRERFPTKSKEENYASLKDYESQHGFNSVTELEKFNERLALIREFTRELIFHIVRKDGKQYAFGASTKGNMICQFLGLNQKHIEFALDNNARKIGSIMIGSDIPIVDEKIYLSRLPEYLLILPYYYLEHFKPLIKKNLIPGQKIYLIVPLPKPHFIELIGKA